MAEDCADDDDDKNGIRELWKRVIRRLQTHDTFVQVNIQRFLPPLFFFLLTYMSSCNVYNYNPDSFLKICLDSEKTVLMTDIMEKNWDGLLIKTLFCFRN